MNTTVPLSLVNLAKARHYLRITNDACWRFNAYMPNYHRGETWRAEFLQNWAHEAATADKLARQAVDELRTLGVEDPEVFEQVAAYEKLVAKVREQAASSLGFDAPDSGATILAFDLDYWMTHLDRWLTREMADHAV